jgi:hypothetical protein
MLHVRICAGGRPQGRSLPRPPEQVGAERQACPRLAVANINILIVPDAVAQAGPRLGGRFTLLAAGAAYRGYAVPAAGRARHGDQTSVGTTAGSTRPPAAGAETRPAVCPALSAGRAVPPLILAMRVSGPAGDCHSRLDTFFLRPLSKGGPSATSSAGGRLGCSFQPSPVEAGVGEPALDPHFPDEPRLSA